MKILIAHDDDCPLGVNGMRAYWEACEALSSTPPEARATDEDRIALALAQFELEEHHVCTCGAVTFFSVEVTGEPEGSTQR